MPSDRRRQRCKILFENEFLSIVLLCGHWKINTIKWGQSQGKITGGRRESVMTSYFENLLLTNPLFSGKMKESAVIAS
jgi:hypothetical protein